MIHALEPIFGVGEDLLAHQMAARAAVLFFLTLVLVRVAGMRAFGHGSAFDTIIVIMLGAVLSRAVTGASPLAPTVAAAIVLVVIHRVVAILGVRFPRLARVLNGQPRVLFHDGAYEERVMVRSGISRRDLDHAARARGLRGLEEVDSICIETTGQLTVIPKRDLNAAALPRGVN